MTKNFPLVSAAVAALLCIACTPQGIDRAPTGGAGGNDGTMPDARAPGRPVDAAAPVPDLRADAAKETPADTRPDAPGDTRADATVDQAAPAVKFTAVFDILIGVGCPGCHDGFIKGRATLTGTEQAFYTRLINEPPSTGSSACRSQLLVVPGKPEQSLLYQLVIPNGNLRGCAKRMPPNDEKIGAADLEVIRRWIAGGAPQ